MEPAGYTYEPKDNLYHMENMEKQEDWREEEDHDIEAPSHDRMPADDEVLGVRRDPSGDDSYDQTPSNERVGRAPTRTVPLRDGSYNDDDDNDYREQRPKTRKVPLKGESFEDRSRNRSTSRSRRKSVSKSRNDDEIDDHSNRSGRSSGSGRRSTRKPMYDESVQSTRSKKPYPRRASESDGPTRARRSSVRAAEPYMKDESRSGARSLDGDGSRQSNGSKGMNRSQMKDYSRRSTASRRESRNLDDASRQSNYSKGTNRSQMKDFSRRSTTSRAIRRNSLGEEDEFSESGRSRKSYQSEKSKEQDPPIRESNRCGMGCCIPILCCLFCLAIIAGVGAAFYLGYFDEIIEDSTSVVDEGGNVNTDGTAIDPSKPPDYGKEFLYGIMAYTLTHTPEDVTISYKVSDYILNDSIEYKLYNNPQCRAGGEAGDITQRNFLFIDVQYDSTPKGDGTDGRFIDIVVKPNFFTISDSEIYNSISFNKATVAFCLGLTVIYNQQQWWINKVEEVNFVETFIEVDMDLRNFNDITAVRQEAITAPQYKR